MTQTERVATIIEKTHALPDDPGALLPAYLIVEVQYLRYAIERLVELLEKRL